MTAATLPARPAAPLAPRRTGLRLGTTLLLTGAMAEYGVTTMHPHREQSNDHVQVFAEYAASGSWIPVHLGQFTAGIVVLIGIVALLSALRSAGAPALLTRIGTVLTGVAGAVLAVLQAVDGVALEHAVDSLAAAPPELHDAFFHDVEVVRWLEWATAGYSRITLGLVVAALAVAVLTSRALPRWTAGSALASAVAFVVDGHLVSVSGFTETILPGLVAWLGLALFALGSSVAAWTARR